MYSLSRDRRKVLNTASYFIVLIILYPIQAYSQNSQINREFTSQAVEFLYSKGVIIPHDDTLKPLKIGFINDFELNYNWFVDGSKAWHNFYKNPQLGITFKYIDLNNPGVLGHAFGIIPTISFRMFKPTKMYSNFRFGFGISYLTKKYSFSTNPSNLAISSSINPIVSLKFETGYNITHRLAINGNISATHISNGAIKKPNYGLNIITYGLGLRLNIIGNKQFATKQSEPRNNKPYLLISLCGGVKEVGSAGGARYLHFTNQISTVKPFQYFEIGTGIDIIYDRSSRYYIHKEQMNYSSPNDDFHIGYIAKLSLLLDKLSFYGDFGIYLYKPNPHFPSIYQRIGMRYTVTQNLSLTIGLKTHLNIADHIDWGVGIKI